MKTKIRILEHLMQMDLVSSCLRSLQGLLLEKATESVSDVDNPGHTRRPTWVSEDAVADDKPQGTTVSPDELIALAQQCSSEFLKPELEQTRIHSMLSIIHPLDLVLEPSKASFKSLMDSPSRAYMGQP